MATDVRLDDDGRFVELEAPTIKAIASDFILDSPDRHKSGGARRRALVHNSDDGLTVNFKGDYPGGVTLVNVAEIIPKPGQKFTPTLVVRGGISYEIEVVSVQPHPGSPISPITTRTVNLSEEMSKLQSQISELKAKVAALEKRP